MVKENNLKNLIDYLGPTQKVTFICEKIFTYAAAVPEEMGREILVLICLILVLEKETPTTINEGDTILYHTNESYGDLQGLMGGNPYAHIDYIDDFSEDLIEIITHWDAVQNKTCTYRVLRDICARAKWTCPQPLFYAAVKDI